MPRMNWMLPRRQLAKGNEIDRLALSLHSRIGLADANELLTPSDISCRPRLNDFLRECRSNLMDLSVQIGETYFLHTFLEGPPTSLERMQFPG